MPKLRLSIPTRSPVALTISNKCRRLKGIEQLYMIEIAWSGAKTKQTPFWCLLRMISSNLVDASWWPQAPSNLQRTSEALGFTWCYTIFRYLSLHSLVPWPGCNWNASIHPRKIGLKFPQDGKKLAGRRKERGAEKVRVSVHITDWERHFISGWLIERQVLNHHSQLIPMYFSKQANVYKKSQIKYILIVTHRCAKYVKSYQIYPVRHPRKHYKHLYTIICIIQLMYISIYILYIYIYIYITIAPRWDIAPAAGTCTVAACRSSELLCFSFWPNHLICQAELRIWVLH